MILFPSEGETESMNSIQSQFNFHQKYRAAVVTRTTIE